MIFVHMFVVGWVVRDCPAGNKGGAGKDVVAVCDTGGGGGQALERTTTLLSDS